MQLLHWSAGSRAFQKGHVCHLEGVSKSLPLQDTISGSLLQEVENK